MNTIIPYNNDIIKSDGAIITPKDDIMLISDNHDIFAKKYLENIDNLNKEELILLNAWLKNNNEIIKTYLDFMIYVLGYDKIQTKFTKSIVTTTNIPHIKYYNYYLMDWYIDINKKIIYNEKNNTFEKEIITDPIKFYKDKELQEEIFDIKSKILKKERYLFYK